MSRRALQPLPELTLSPTGQWPTIVAAPTDRSVNRTPVSYTKPIWTTQSSRPLYLFRRLPVAVLKGVALAAALIGMAFGIVPAWNWWLSTPHWIAGLMLVISLAVLGGTDIGILAVVAIAWIQALPSIHLHGIVALRLGCLVIAERVLWECLLAVRAARK